MMQTTSLDNIADICADVLRTSPRGLFSDFDGTLSMVAPTPDSATAADGAVEAIDRLSRLADVIGVVTGRAVDDVIERVRLPQLSIVGNHGLEWLQHGERVDHEAGLAAQRGVAMALAEIEAGMSNIMSTRGLLFENKRLSAAIHYRNTGDPARVHEVLEPLAKAVSERHHLKTVPGKMVIEIRPDVLVGKGTALEQLVQMHRLRGVLFFGDDVSDVDGFLSLKALRERDGIRALAIGVCSPDVHPDVIANADFLVTSVAENVKLLEMIADRLEISP